MNPFRVDLHVHSRFSRATSGKLNVRNLAAWSLVKGLSIMATGDFTHPAWRDELRRDLVLDETSGLYRVREEVDVAAELPGFTRPHEGREPLFLLQAEISSIYKKNGAVRKVHNLVFMPDMESADRLSARLGAVGNITSDGRPILGLDSERLLEMVLETSERGVLIPAHIWTPWFSLFGSKSGFDALEDCFGALSSHIFALETGLSSDPDMNRLWSKLDNYALVSNSDAHSGENLGREANLFTGTPTYDGLFDALRRAAHKLPERDDCQFKGTVEFFPEEGKYHLDGHRACNVVLEPEASQKLHNICPECGKPLTVGVLHRVKELADRTSPLMQGSAFVSLIPLPEMLGELLSVGAKSRKVQLRQAEVVRLFGSELDILHHVPEADLRQHWDALGEAVSRMRRGEVIREGGYDGEYGVVRVFTPQERDELVTGRLHQSLLELPKKRKAKTVAPATPPVQTQPAAPVQKTPPPKSMSEPAPEPDPAHFPYSEAQQQALHAGSHPVLVLAGPGAGKTRTLVGRIERLVQEGVPVARILAVTFTRRAAAELHARLTRALGATALPRADTLHALALSQWSSSEDMPTVLSEEAARTVFATANAEPASEHSKADQKAHAARLRTAWDKLALHRERLTTPEPELLPWLEHYSAYKLARNMADYTDLLEHWLARLTADTSGARLWTEILVDEIQDFSPLQLALIRALLPDTSPAGQGFFGIGDPDQAIYGFRGAQPDIRGALATVWPELLTITLSASHRSTAGILISASQLLGAAAACGHLVPTRTGTASLHLFSAPDARHEAVWIAEQISLLLGGTSHTLEDARHTASPLPTPCSPGDIVVLVRLKALIPTLQAALTQRGIPCAVPQATPFWDDPVVTAVLEAARNCHGGKHTGDSGEQGLPEAIWAKGPLAVLEALEHAGHAGHAGQTDLLSSNPLFVKSAACAALVRAYKEQGSWEALLDWVLVRQDLDLVREHAEQVQIMTLHAAKGLEFRAVFVPALEEGLLPFAGATALLHSGSAEPAPAEAIAEERRLLYVGLTRAQDAVFLSHAEQRTLYGQTLCLPPSHFLDALPDLFTRSHLVRHTARTTKQLTLL